MGQGSVHNLITLSTLKEGAGVHFAVKPIHDQNIGCDFKGKN